MIRLRSIGFHPVLGEDELADEGVRRRHHWNVHEPRMFERVKGLSDEQLRTWDLTHDLVSVRLVSMELGKRDDEVGR